MTIVPFTKQDQKSTQKFMESIFEEMQWPTQKVHGLDDLASLFHLSDHGFLYVVKQDNTIVGSGGCVELPNKNFLLKRFYLAKALRGTGLAKKLLTTLIQEAKKRKASRIVIDVSKKNARATHFYLKTGFIQYNPKPLPAWPESLQPTMFHYYFLPIR